MPKEFAGGVETPQNLKSQFTENVFVDTENNLENLPKDAAALAKGTSQLVVQSFNKQVQTDADKEEEYYAQARRLKRQIYESGQKQDNEAAGRYMAELENLKIAERQGAINGTNAQIRKDTLLRSYINRFPHLEEEFRQVYSNTRARAAAARAEQFKDPIEEGVDSLIKEAVENGRSVPQQLELKQRQDRHTYLKMGMEEAALIGQNLEQQFSEMYDNRYRAQAYAALVDWSHKVAKLGSRSADFNEDQARGLFRQLKEQFLNDFQGNINDIVAKGPDPSAQLRPEFVAGKRKELTEMFDSFEMQLKGMDTITRLSRDFERAKFIGYQALQSISPLYFLMVQLNPEKAGKMVFDTWETSRTAYKTQGAPGLRKLIETFSLKGDWQNAEASRVHLQLLENYDGKLAASDFQRMLTGQPPSLTNVPVVDAARVGTHTTAAIRAGDGLTEEQKGNVVAAAIKTEEQAQGVGPAVSPSKVWYLDDERAGFLKSNPIAQKQMETTLSTMPERLVRNTDPKVMSQIMFAQDLEKDSQYGKAPWKAYPSGGPFALSTPEQQSKDKVAEMQRSLPSTDPGAPMMASPYQDNTWAQPAITALNTMYWIMRKMKGADAAEEWAQGVGMLTQGTGTLSKEGKPEANPEPKGDGSSPGGAKNKGRIIRTSSK